MVAQQPSIDFDRATGRGSTADGFRLRIWPETPAGRYQVELQGPIAGLICATSRQSIAAALDWADTEIALHRRQMPRHG